MTPEMISYAAAAFMLVAAILDSKTGKIPNWLIGLGIVLFLAKVFLFPDSVDLIWQPVFAGCLFIGGVALFLAGATGAGAVKLVTVVALFMPLDHKGLLGGVLLAAIILSLIVFGMLRSALGSDDSTWSVLRRRVIPLAVPIGITGLIGLFVV